MMLATAIARLGILSFMPIMIILLICKSQGIETMNCPIFESSRVWAASMPGPVPSRAYSKRRCWIASLILSTSGGSMTPSKNW